MSGPVRFARLNQSVSALSYRLFERIGTSCSEGTTITDMRQALINGTIFDGDNWLHDHCVLLAGGDVAAVEQTAVVDLSGWVVHDLAGQQLVPGFIDLQVNGGGGALFNADPSIETLRVISAAHRQFGTTGLLPTLVTDSYDTMRKAIVAVEEAIDKAVPGILGIHLEGPFLNPARRGIHDASGMQELDEEGFEILTSLTAGTTLVTLAPECTTADTIRRLREAGVIVSIGHSDATYQQACAALEAGATGFTHLFNAMSQMQNREPGVVGAAIVDRHSWFGIIADGHHVHPAMLQLALQSKCAGGAVLVTDAMPCVGTDNNSFELYGEAITVEGGRCATADGTLAGSNLDMWSAINNAVKLAGVSREQALCMASCYPAAAIKLAATHGYIRAGYQADLLLVSDAGPQACWIAGEHFKLGK